MGGVWAQENLYPGLRANNLVGTYEFSDFPMHEGFGVRRGEHIPGKVVHEYFRQYPERFGLARRLLLGWKVRSAELVAGGGVEVGAGVGK